MANETEHDIGLGLWGWVDFWTSYLGVAAMSCPCKSCRAGDEVQSVACNCCSSICSYCGDCEYHCKPNCPGAQEAIDQWEEDRREYWEQVGKVEK